MTPAELHDAFRSDVVDQAKPYLWSEDEVWRYMNSAYMSFWRFVGGIPDFTSLACSVRISAGIATSALHPSILRVMYAYRHSDSEQIQILNSPDLNRGRSDDYGMHRAFRLDNTLGPVRHMVLGLQKNVARWLAVPQIDDSADLHIYRLPLEAVTDESDDFAELEDIHHEYLLLWMKHLAYSKQDAETFDKSRADQNEAAFRGYCAACKAEQERYEFKVREVQYGGL